jgi:hypothetical protein
MVISRAMTIQVLLVAELRLQMAKKKNTASQLVVMDLFSE